MNKVVVDGKVAVFMLQDLVLVGLHGLLVTLV